MPGRANSNPSQEILARSAERKGGSPEGRLQKSSSQKKRRVASEAARNAPNPKALLRAYRARE